MTPPMTPEALAALHARANTVDRAWSGAEFASLLARPGAVLLGSGQGFLLGQILAGEGEVLTLATDPAHRRRGIARGLLARFEDQARQGGADAIFLEVAEDNAPAAALYAAAGYLVAGRRPGYYPRNSGRAVAALVLRKPL